MSDDGSDEEFQMDESPQKKKPKLKIKLKADPDAAPSSSTERKKVKADPDAAPSSSSVVKKKKKDKDKKRKASSSSAASSVKKKVKTENGAKPAGKTKKLKELDKTERLTFAMQSFLWWDADEPPEGCQWRTMEHAGVSFPESYVPHGVKMKYDGQEVDLTPQQEEA